MTDRLLYETIIPASLIITVALLSAEFIGSRKHIGRAFSFFMMLGIIPGIIGLLFSPSAKTEPTKANPIYLIIGVFLLLSGTLTFYQMVTNDFYFINLFVFISFYMSAFYSFELSKGNVRNDNHNNYFDRTIQERNIERNIEQKVNDLETQIESLSNLKEKGILTEEEYNQKVSKIEEVKTNENLKNSKEYKQLKSLLDSGVLTKEEFENKIILLNIKDSIIENKFEIKSFENYIIENKIYTAEQIKSHFENGNYFIDKNTFITLNDGSQKTFGYIKELSFLFKYFPPK
jgi:Ca2+/Na+ antiporter